MTRYVRRGSGAKIWIIVFENALPPFDVDLASARALELSQHLIDRPRPFASGWGVASGESEAHPLLSQPQKSGAEVGPVVLGAEESDAWYAAQSIRLVTEEVLEGAHEGCGVGSCSDDVSGGEGWESGFGGIRMSVGDDLGLEIGENAEPIVGVDGAARWQKPI